MTLKSILVSILVSIFAISIFGVDRIYAQDCTGSLDQKIECFKSELGKLGTQSKTLSNQISQFDAQIKLTTLKVAQTEEKIALLSGRIDQLTGSLDSLTKAFSERASETYKMTRLSDPLTFILTSSSLNDVYSRYTYLKKIQESDRDLLHRLSVAKETYNNEKLDQVELQNDLSDQKKILQTQKNSKNTLLSQTKNDEKRYQSLLSDALAEKAAIEKALISGVNVGPVKAGDAIAMVGNSGYPGCSTGKHLHFEIRKNGSWTDPTQYLQNKSVQDDEKGVQASIGSGSWPWPIQDPIRLTQHYGHTPWSWVYSYSGGIHTGFDMISSTSDVIRAPANGTLYKSSEKCGSSTINIVYIEHGDGVISFYLHVQ